MHYDKAPHWLVKMPKTDLHCHLGGSLRPRTILALADEFGVKLPTDDDEKLRTIISCKGKPKNLACYLEKDSTSASPSCAQDKPSRASRTRSARTRTTKA